MAECPKCRTKLVEQPSNRGLLFVCPGCGGRAMGIDALHKANVDTLFLTSIWEKSHEPKIPHFRPCPHCGRPMAAVDARISNRPIFLDICTTCHSIWFDSDEIDKLPPKPVAKPEKPLSDKAKNALLNAELAMNREIYSQADEEPSSPLKHFLWVLGLSPIEVDEDSEKIPYFAWGMATLIGLFSIILILTMKENIWALGFLPSNWSNYMGITIISSLFIHLRLMHIVANIVFLAAVGSSLERSLGWKKMLQLMLLSHFAGLFLYYMIFPNIATPYFGASAAIAGLLAYKAAINPQARYSLFPPIAGHYYNMRWHKMVINSGSLLVIYCIGQIGVMINWRYTYFEGWRSDHWLFMSFMTVGGVVVGLFAGLWHRAVENEKRNKAPLEIKSDIP